MLSRDQLLSEVRTAIAQGTLSQSDVAGLFESPDKRDRDSKHSKIAVVLYYIGGLVIFLGVAYFIVQEWEKMGSALRIFVTLGFGLAFTITGTILALRQNMLGISDAFHLIGGLLIPSGIFVTLYELGYRDGRWGTAFIFLALAVLWWVHYHYRARLIVLVFSIIYGSIGYYLLANALFQNFPQAADWDLPYYALLGLGGFYSMLGYALRDKTERLLVGPLYFFGAPIILGSTMALQGYNPDQNVFWELVYPILLFGGLYISVYLKSRSFLVFSSIFVVGFIIKIMSEYFRNELSGPLLIILSGALIMAMGYLIIHLNRKYFKGGAA